MKQYKKTLHHSFYDQNKHKYDTMEMYSQFKNKMYFYTNWYHFIKIFYPTNKMAQVFLQSFLGKTRVNEDFFVSVFSQKLQLTRYCFNRVITSTGLFDMIYF